MIFSTKAPELEGITGWINTKLLTMEDLKGKVVLVDFWTYTCINCLRTLPYIKEWHEKYAKHGLVIVGIHTPEFEFEKDIRNVKDAVKRHKIKHPIALDSNYEMFKAYNNHYWPRKYLIDADGKIVYDHIGEGGYGETEEKIIELLNKIGKRLPKKTIKPV